MKKQLYIVLVIILWLLLSFALHCLLWQAGGNSITSPDPLLQYRAFPLLFQITIPVIGLLLGFIIGQRRRYIVYVQKKHRSDLWKNKQDSAF